MTRFRAVLSLVLFTLLLPLFFMQFSRWGEATAAPATPTMSGITIGVVADTTESMGPELASFSSAWQDQSAGLSSNQTAIDAFVGAAPDTPAEHCDPICPYLTSTFRLVDFKNTAIYRGATTNYGGFGQSLSGLEASGGGSCPDNALVGLLTMGKNLPPSKILASDVALVTDATPFGKRSNYAFVMNKMLRRGVNVHSLVSGWCAGAPIPETALQFLTQATGGHYYRPAVASDYYTESLMIQDKLFATDLLLSREGSVSGEAPDDISFRVDSSMFGFSAETLGYVGCLTCPLASLAQLPTGLSVTADPDVQIELRDPDGNVIDENVEGFSKLSSSSRQMLKLYPHDDEVLKTGAWNIRVSGDGNYQLVVVAQTGFHFAYLGPGSIPLSRPSFLRVALGELGGKGVLPPLTSTFKLIPMHGAASTQSIELFDDGEHGDGAAGDGIFGGMVQPTAPGWWRLAAEGELDDGSPFRRLAEVPLRVQQYRLTKPASILMGPDETRLITFTLRNEATPTTGALALDEGAAETTTFELALFSEQGWTITDTVPTTVTLGPGEGYTVTTSVVIPPDAPLGAMEESTFVAVDVNDVNTGLTAVAETTVGHNPLYIPLVVR